MSTYPEPPTGDDAPNAEASAGSAAPTSDARRRLLRGSLASGTVLMTVLSRPVLAGNVGPTVSAFASTQFSSATQGTVSYQQYGQSCQTWANTPSWPSPYCATSSTSSSSSGTGFYSPLNTSSSGTGHGSGTQQATLFQSSTTGFGGHVFQRTATMLDVLNGSAGGGGYAQLGRYCAAALLNAAAGRTPYLTESTVRQIWNSIVGSPGYFTPTAGVRWGASQAVAYLQSTMA
jgi:hypothetical protein